MNEDTKEVVTKQGCKTIILNITEANHPRFIEDISYAKQVIDSAISEDRHQKVFPQGTADITPYRIRIIAYASAHADWPQSRTARLKIAVPNLNNFDNILP